MADYQRPELTDQEQRKLAKVVGRFFAQPRQAQIQFVAKLLAENTILTREVNEHRAARGYETLPTYTPD